ncbi:uncharacterized protein HaLaN_27610, partial [Haematococcus lacustris]
MAKAKTATAKAANGKAKKDVQEAVKPVKKPAVQVSDDSDSDVPPPAQKIVAKGKATPAAAPTKAPAKKSAPPPQEDSDDDDDSDEEEPAKPAPKPAANGAAAKAKKQKDDTGKAVPKPATPAAAAAVTDRETGRPRGFGYVEFENASAAAKAAKTLNGSDMDGRQIKVEVATPRAERAPGGGGGEGDPEGTTVFIKGFDSSQPEDDIKAALEEAFAECGQVKSIRLPSDRESGTLKGIGYVEFESVEAKNKAVELSGSEVAGGYLTVDGNVKPRTPYDGS